MTVPAPIVSPEVRAPGSHSKVDFVLPGRWWHIAITTPEATGREIRTMVRSVVGRDDSRAQLRREMQASVQAAAATAAKLHGSDFYFALEIVPGVPIPASLAVCWPPIPAGLAITVSARAGADALAGHLQAVETSATIDILVLGSYDVVRVVKTRTGQLSAGTGIEGAGEVVASYWLLRQDARVPLLLSFSSALVSMKDEMIPLFDAIVSTVDWTEPPTA